MIGLLSYWKYIAMGLLVVALGVQSLRLSWLQTEVAEDKIKQQEAIALAEAKSTNLSNELIIAQAQALAVTEKKVVQFVDRIRNVSTPDTACAADPRMRIGSAGVRELVLPDDQPKAGSGPVDGVSGPATGPRPR